MTTYDGPSGNGGATSIRPDRLVEAAGGLDSLVALFDGKTDGLETSVDTGHDDVNTALQEFTARWSFGLSQLLDGQTKTAETLRSIVADIVKVDVDAAYDTMEFLQLLESR